MTLGSDDDLSTNFLFFFLFLFLFFFFFFFLFLHEYSTVIISSIRVAVSSALYRHQYITVQCSVVM